MYLETSFSALLPGILLKDHLIHVYTLYATALNYSKNGIFAQCEGHGGSLLELWVYRCYVRNIDLNYTYHILIKFHFMIQFFNERTSLRLQKIINKLIFIFVWYFKIDLNTNYLCSFNSYLYRTMRLSLSLFLSRFESWIFEFVLMRGSDRFFNRPTFVIDNCSIFNL